MAKDYTHRLNLTATSIPPIDTFSCFNVAHTEAEKSPIDSCFEKMNNLNLIHIRFSSIAGISTDVVGTQNNLILLGYISAVESYLREIIRKLIMLDKASRISSQEQQLNYGAAINYPSNLLPEALMERSSYASKTNIKDALKTFIGLKGQHANELDKALDEFEKICHLRHCVVHRFGKLGSSNAMKFGLDTHIECLEKPLSLDVGKLYNIYQICENTVLVLNHYLYTNIMKRTVEPDYSFWQWDLRKDRNNFAKYYNLFASTIKGESSSNLNKAYYDLKDYKVNK